MTRNIEYQDVLAAVGAGSAHPGGSTSTELWLKELSFTPATEVLDIGCGTGRTALSIRKQYGCKVTGLDIRAGMLEKARLRAKLGELTATWRLGSAERLPFRDEQFDVIVAESVNVFVNPEKSLEEACRVLRESGSYVNVEMFLLAPMDKEWFRSLRQVYGVKSVPDLNGWKQLYRKAGFKTIRILTTRSVGVDLDASHQQYDAADNLSSPGVFQNPQVMSMLSANAQWLNTNSRYLGYTVCICSKQEELEKLPSGREGVYDSGRLSRIGWK